ncbi:c transferase [Phytophthora cinnamomi]|uniref:c transferase n=1 Tax=Phytophthora cinnamomi TaxID=4785 RepID=UPI0035598E1E|nr:c transferase [Phytophthora cinnamomi]
MSPADGEKGASPAVLRLRRQQVEALVHGLKKVSPELDLRNVVPTQFAIFVVVSFTPGDGARFVKHLETYSNAQRDERGAMSKDGLVRLVTRVYYLHDEREPDHGGELRVHLENSKHLPASHWEFPPKLDTLMVFRSLDVEHEVLQTYRERKAVTIWYYGKATKVSARSAGIAVPRALLSITGEQAVHAKQASIFVAIPSYRDSECRHTVDNLLAQASFPSVGICLQVDDDERI